jgi:hypothetical protein
VTNIEKIPDPSPVEISELDRRVSMLILALAETISACPCGACRDNLLRFAHSHLTRCVCENLASRNPDADKPCDYHPPKAAA